MNNVIAKRRSAQADLAQFVRYTVARGGRGGGSGGRAGRGASNVTLPSTRPTPGLRADDWNQVEVLIDANIVRTYINDGGEIGSAADEDAGRFGPLAPLRRRLQ